MSSPHIKRVVDDQGIIKSAEDKRLYRALELTNGMRVMLISDPHTDKSSAAMDVCIGMVLKKYCMYLKLSTDVVQMGHGAIFSLPVQMYKKSCCTTPSLAAALISIGRIVSTGKMSKLTGLC